MKPISITIEGINSFIEAQTLDFEDAGRSNLFCISGKTGAGKTTVFDSIMLALYGKSTKGNLADVVNLSLNCARVRFEFDERGERYAVERTIKCRLDKTDAKKERRIAASDCVLYKAGEPVAKGDEVIGFVRDIIGLEASEFKNVYLLEQGEYAEFLKKTPAKQTEAVGKIFSLMRFGDVHKLAAEKAKRLGEDIARLKEQADELDENSPELLKEKKDNIKQLRAKLTAETRTAETHAAELAELEKIRDSYISAREKQNSVKSLLLQLDESKKRAHRSAAALDEYNGAVDTTADAERLTALRGLLNKMSALNALDNEYKQSTSALETKKTALIAKRKTLDIAKANYTAADEKKSAAAVALSERISEYLCAARKIPLRSHTLSDSISALDGESAAASVIAEWRYNLAGEASRHAEFEHALADNKETISKLADEIAKKLDIIAQFNKKLDESNRNLKSAHEHFVVADHALFEAQLHSHAAAVRAELRSGDSCPVCGGTFVEGVACGDLDVESRKAERMSAERDVKDAERNVRDVSSRLDRAKNDYDVADRELDKIKRSSAELEQKLKSTCVEPQEYKLLLSLLDRAKVAAENLHTAENDRHKLGPEYSKLDAEHAAAESAVTELEQKIGELGARLGEHCGKTAERIIAVKSELAALEKQLADVAAQRQSLEGEARAATAAVAAIERSLETAKANCPVDLPPFDEEAYTQKRETLDRQKKLIAEYDRNIAVTDAEITGLAERCDRLNKLKSELGASKKRIELYDEISRLTHGKAMLNFVAAEYIAEFTAVAGEILNELSSGKYAMSYDSDNGFVVYDYLNSGKPRKTDTLSGGELFLASLSVAIAIARTQSNGNNAFFFLDEGFGTLDEDLIDVVYGALEALSKDCLVGVITHAEALISRMPSCVTIYEATDTCGSRISS